MGVHRNRMSWLGRNTNMPHFDLIKQTWVEIMLWTTGYIPTSEHRKSTNQRRRQLRRWLSDFLIANVFNLHGWHQGHCCWQQIIAKTSINSGSISFSTRVSLEAKLRRLERFAPPSRQRIGRNSSKTRGNSNSPTFLIILPYAGNKYTYPLGRRGVFENTDEIGSRVSLCRKIAVPRGARFWT